MNGRIQQWLTPALLGAGLILLGWLVSDVRQLGDKVERMLLQIQVHRTVLIQEGLLKMTHGADIP